MVGNGFPVIPGAYEGSTTINGTIILEEDNVPQCFYTGQDAYFLVCGINMHALLMNKGPVKIGGAGVTCSSPSIATDGRSITPGEEMHLGWDIDLVTLFAVGKAGDKVEFVASTLIWWFIFFGLLNGV